MDEKIQLADGQPASPAAEQGAAPAPEGVGEPMESGIPAAAEAGQEAVLSGMHAPPAPDLAVISEKWSVSRQVASKWVKTSVLLQDQRIARHIPETRMYSRENAEAMLNRYGKIVLKPVVGTGGSGVIMIMKTGALYLLRYQRRMRKFRSFAALMAAVERIKRKRSYLVQRGISLATIRGRPIDYRVKVVKQNKRWVTRAMVGRLANPGLFVTNLCRGGKMLSSAEGIRRSLPRAGVRNKKNEMRQVTRIGIQLMERHFPGIRELGFDYGFDRAGYLWIFEVNTRPH